ncbi:MAG: hypothetical protein N3E49_08125 [Bacteroidia bacterium]|nr:hypothetical protein [Bacteroidia bacterium]
MSFTNLNPPPSEIEQQFKRTRLRNTRLVAWLIFASKLLSLGSALAAEGVSSEVRQTFLWIRVPDAILSLLMGFIIQFSSSVPPILRLLLLLNVTVVVLIEGVLTQPFSGWTFAWINFTATMGSLIAFDLVKERKYGYFAILGHLLLTLLGIIVQPKLSFITPNPITHGTARFLLITLMIGIAGLIVFDYYRKVMHNAISFSDQLEEALEKQKTLAEEAWKQKAIAEQRQAEAEAAFAEVARLREAELQTARRQKFLIEYETLMRESYTRSLKDFGQALLETLSRDLPMIGGVLYLKAEDEWQVIAAYAFPSETERKVQSGLLDMVASCRLPYVIAPPPPGTKRPYAALHIPAPAALLYLPFYSEATDESVMIAEVLLAESLPESTLALVREILPRVGTYVWGRLRQDLTPHIA